MQIAFAIRKTRTVHNKIQKRDEVLKRPLKMKPQPQNKSTTNEDRDLNFADSKESSEISDEGNRQVARMQFLSCSRARDSDYALGVA